MNFLVFKTVLGFASDGLVSLFAVIIIGIIIGVVIVTIRYFNERKRMELEVEELLHEELRIQKEQSKRKEKEAQAKREKEETDREAKKQAIFNEKFTRLLESPDYVFVKQFAKKHEDVKTEKDYLRFKNELSKLNTLLQNKQWDFSEDELLMSLDWANLLRRSSEIESKILKNDSLNKRELIISYLDHYKSDDETKLWVLEKVLKERNLLEGDIQSLKDYVSKIEEEIELEKFEKQLREGTEQIRLEDIDRLSGYEFEEFLKSLFEKRGYQVEQTSAK